MATDRDFSKVAHSNGLAGKMPAIVDASEHCDGIAAHLKQLGVKVVIRYYALRFQPNLPQKILNKPEADTILDSGLSLALSYQYNNGNITSFTPTRAEQDVEECIKKMAEIGQPKGSAIYFGVDKDWTDAAHTKQVTRYFEVINQRAGGKFEVGVYGSGFTCRLMERLKLAKFFWIAGLSDGWAGRAKALESNSWNMYQNVLELPVNAVKVDTDVVNPRRPVIGSFHRASRDQKAVLDGPVLDERSIAVQRIAARDTDLRESPNGTVIRLIPASKIMILVENKGEFSVVDVPRQIGKPERADFERGYCPSNALMKIPTA